VKGFFSPIDKLAAELPRTKGTGAEFMTELSKRPGYKPQEAQDRDLQTLMALPKMAREEFLAKLKSKPAQQLEDTTLTNTTGHTRLQQLRSTGELTKYDQWTLPGGSNYREILMRMPHDEQRAKEFSDPASGHWDVPNVLAHVRAKDRTGPNGEKLLHIEEIQSDWHQQGRDRGYATPESLQELRAAELRHKLLKQQLEQAKTSAASAEASLARTEPMFQQPDVRARYDAARIQANNELMDLMPQVLKAQAEVQDIGHKLNNVVPNAPFKKNWHELALKKMIHHAAEKGYHGIVITPGQEQTNRYDLSKHINDIRYDPYHKQLIATGHRGEAINKIAEPHELPSYVGKDVAEKLLKTPISQGMHKLSNLDLETGGEGMKGFYDKIVPSFLNQFGKKYGAQVGTMPIKTPNEDPWGVGDAAKFHGMSSAEYLDNPNRPQLEKQFLQARHTKTTPVHHFPITPEMREDVTKNGVPLYSDGGEVGDIQDTARQNDAYPDIEKYLQARDALPDVQISDNLPEGTNGMFTSINLPIGSGQLKLSKNAPKQILPSVLTHEMSHAADRQMMQQAMEQSMFGKGNQFTEAYQKLVGPEGRNRTDLARKVNPDWASDNQYYRALPQEIAAHGIGAFSGPNTQSNAPKHVDATAATEFQILLDLARRNANNGPQGLAKIPAFFRKIGGYAGGGSTDRINMHHKDVIKRIPELTAAANEVEAGNMTYDQYQALVNKHKPVMPFASVPDMPSDEEIHNALTSDKREKIGAHRDIENGTHVGGRLDIPAYKDHGVWVVSVHEGKNGANAGPPIGYDSHLHIINPKFGVSVKGAMNYATGKKDKNTFATVNGAYNKLSRKQAKALANLALNHKDWIQVGMDPERHTHFYDRATQRPIKEAAESLQIGPMVFVKHPVYHTDEEMQQFPYAKGGAVKPQHARDANLAQFLKDSAVKNRMYHGTNKDIKSFKAPKNAVGIWATKNPDVANEYATISARGVGEPPSVYPVHVRLKNPANKDQFGDAWDLAAKDSSRLGWNTHDERHKKILQDQGFDGAILDDSVVVFDPKHIKSAIGNRGTYDVNEPDITKAKGGSIKPVGYTKEKVTVSPSLDQMMYELISVKHSKKVK